MLVKIRLTRAANAQAHGVPLGSVAEIDLETYLLGVVPSEAYESRTPEEALKAQAIAARTYAMRKALDGTTLTDTPTHQSYDASLATTSPRSRAAVEATAGLVLLYGGQPIQAYYSRSNGGWTRRTEDVWSTALPYYQSRIDHWDASAVAEALNRGMTIKPSHGVGLSQVGAEYAAKQGASCADILAFYYPGADVGRYGGNNMAKPKARAVCATARKCATQSPPIPYVWGKESATQQDCQGHVEYCVRANGGTMSYAGSNDMLRNACSWVGTLAEARAQGKLIPGALLFQVKPGGDYPAKYHGDGKGNAQHVGMYIGDPDIEITHASSSAGRVTTSTFKSTWTHVGLAKAIDYSDVLGSTAPPDMGNPASENAVLGIIATQKDPLNMRAVPISGTVVCKIPRGAQVVIVETATVGSTLWGRTTWTQGGILYGGWVCMDYVTLIREEPTQTSIIVAVPVATQAHADQLLAAYPGAYVI